MAMDMRFPSRVRSMRGSLVIFELGQHETTRDGITSYEDRVRLHFELSGKRHPPRDVDGVFVPYILVVEMTLGLLPGDLFFETFARMNFESAASHMAALLGEAFMVYVGHRRFRHRRGAYPIIEADKEGYLIGPAKGRDEATGELLAVDIAPCHYRLEAFVWKTADLDDWYSIYMPGEWPEQRNDQTGELIKKARSRNVLQECMVAARNWPEHPLYGTARLGPDPNAPSPEELARQRTAELKEWRAGNCRRLKAAVDEVLAKFPKEPPKRQTRSTKVKRPPASN
ncbi:MAG: hypothetical protein WCA85_19855 [Paraburkholderia sp.]|uniref:hypothetical protein n=1 Tax=Paraburkholderia sp. TaxID=1926495 RepID=UPI003C3C2E63